jgi:kexin
VIIFGAGAGFYFWRRHVRCRKPPYIIVAPGEDVPMVDQGSRTASGRNRDGGRTKELYDAFGEVSDDEADEETGLRRPQDSAGPTGLEFHAGFLEDDDPESATSAVPYRDEPDEREPSAHEQSPQERSGSPGSGDDGSWEHASQQARAE